MEKTNATKRTDLFHIDPRNIVVVDGFNVRRDFDLEELKEQIKANGVLNPLTVIPFKDEDGVERYKLVDGERRYRATMLAISEGADIKYVKALKAPKNASTEDLYIEQMMRNEGKRFSEYECAIMFRRFKEEFGYSQVEIADKFKKSPSFVCKCLSLLDLPPKIQEQIATGKLSAMAARKIMDTYSTAEECEGAADAAIQAAQSSGRKTATNREVKGHAKDSLAVNNMLSCMYTIQAYSTGLNEININVLIDSLKRSATLQQAFNVYKYKISVCKGEKKNDVEQ